MKPEKATVSQYSYTCFTSLADGRRRFKKIAAFERRLDNARRNVDGRAPLSLLAQQEKEREFQRRNEKLRAVDSIMADLLNS